MPGIFGGLIVGAVIRSAMQVVQNYQNANQNTLNRQNQNEQNELNRQIQREENEKKLQFQEEQNELNRRSQEEENERNRQFQEEQRRLDRQSGIEQAVVQHVLTIEQMKTRAALDAKARAESAERQKRAALEDKIVRSFPLYNEIEVLALEPSLDNENPIVAGCRRVLESKRNKRGILPCQFYTAFKGTNPLITDFNYNLSSFIAAHYDPNEEHAVESNIGNWKTDADVTDEQIGRVHSIFRDFPTMICIPHFYDGNQVVSFKMWTWGFYEDQYFPSGIEFHRVDVKRLRNSLIQRATLKWKDLLQKFPEMKISDELRQNLEICDYIENEQLTDEQRNLLTTRLVSCSEVAGEIDKEINRAVSEVVCYIVAVFADLYHFLHYSTPPKLPSILCQAEGLEELAPEIRKFYNVLYQKVLERAKELFGERREGFLQACVALKDFCNKNGDSEGGKVFNEWAILLLPYCDQITQGEYLPQIDFDENRSFTRIGLDR